MRIGVLTSGGDAPGMNAAVRAVVRTVIARGGEAVGIERGYHGLVDDHVIPLSLHSVSGIIDQGGTIIKTARCERFKTPEGQAAAAETIARHGIEGIAIVGGDGSYRGALALNKTCGAHVIGLPGTIDNDIPGTLYTIGFDTAVNTALEAIDRIRDTSESHDRVFVVEVMGRADGSIAMEVALAGSAEAVITPEHHVDMVELCRRIQAWRERGKMSCIVVVAEGAASGAAVGATITQVTGIETRVSVLGHIQRGGSPTARDRSLATRMGVCAADLLLAGSTNLMVGVDEGGATVTNPLEEVLQQEHKLDASLFDVLEVTAT